MLEEFKIRPVRPRNQEVSGVVRARDRALGEMPRWFIRDWIKNRLIGRLDAHPQCLCVLTSVDGTERKSLIGRWGVQNS